MQKKKKNFFEFFLAKKEVVFSQNIYTTFWDHLLTNEHETNGVAKARGGGGKRGEFLRNGRGDTDGGVKRER